MILSFDHDDENENENTNLIDQNYELVTFYQHVTVVVVMAKTCLLWLVVADFE